MLEHPLGSGAFATVWRGFDPDLDSVVAIKVLAENWAVDADVRERFLTEARLLRRIAHPSVVRVHDVGVELLGGIERPYLVMDLVAGGSLADRIGHLPADRATALLRQAADAVQVLHDEGVIHRDVKPSNLLVDDTGGRERVLVADLGSAKLLQQASTLTMVAGTPAYMAPEQAAGTELDARADVYALGVVAFELYAGTLPPHGATALPPMAEAHGLPAAIDGVLATATAPLPADRFASAAALGTALERAAAGEAEGGSGEGSESASESGRGWPAAGVIAVALVLFVTAALAVWRL